MAKKQKFQTVNFDIRAQDPMQVNVRHDAADGSLRPVGPPASCGRAPGALLGAVACDGRDVIVSSAGDRIFITDPAKDAPVEIAAHDGEITAGVGVDGGMLLTGDHAGTSPCRLDVDYYTGAATLDTPLPRHGAPRLVRVDDGVLSRPMPARKLKGIYSRTAHIIEHDDMHDLTADYAEAYCDLCDLAAARSRYIQPVIARLTARDARGTIVYRSAPVMISPASGVQLLEVERTLGGQDFNEAGGVTLQAVPFSIGICFPAEVPAAWRSRVATLEVETTSQLHPVSLKLPSAVRVSVSASGSATLAVTAPGADTASGGVAGEGSIMRRRVESLLGQQEKAFAVARTMPFPSVPAPVSGIFRAAGADCRAEAMAVSDARPADAENASDQPAAWMMNYPHTFSAACGAAGGGMVMWGCVTTRLFDGYTVAEQSISISPATSAQPTTSIVTLADGRMLVDSVTETSAVSAELSPLIVYPHPAAVKVTIITGTKKWEAPLRPTPCRRMAYALASDLKPVRPSVEQGMHIVPEGSSVTERYPSAVAVAPLSSPLDIVAAATAGDGRITAVTPVLRSGSSLDISRRQFYVFTRRGIMAVSVAGNPARITPVLLDHRPVMMAQSVAESADGVLAIAGEDLVMVSGNKVATLLVNTGPCSVGRCGRYGEIWIVSAASDPTLIFNPATKYAFYRNDLYPDEMLNDGARLLLRPADGRLHDASEELSRPMPVEIKSRICLPRARAVGAMGVRLICSGFSGSIYLAGDNGIHSPDGAYRIVAFDVEGELNRPLESRVVAHPFRYVTLGISGRMSADARLESAWCAIKT
ncbi:MAG: hypothetical protein K2H98_06080 [Duncaniella sp.]|nr:hypothetical protein [Duncaniella sp.]